MRINLVTGNEGKFMEISGWLEDTDLELVRDEGPFIEVQADSLEEVILFGMEELRDRREVNMCLMKDDSGLFIDALGGFPGVYSAYVNGTIGNRGILDLMKDNEDRKARFKTVIGVHVPGRGISFFRGECRGTISKEMKGEHGFGYDPIFIPEGEKRTFAQMETVEKNSMSHRIRAVRKMVDHFSGDRS